MSSDADGHSPGDGIKIDDIAETQYVLLYPGWLPILTAQVPHTNATDASIRSMKYYNMQLNHNVLQKGPVAQIIQNYLGNFANMKNLPEASLNNDTMHVGIFKQVSFTMTL